MIENKVIHYKDSMMINSNGYDQAYIIVPTSFLTLYEGNKDSLDNINDEILKRLFNDFGFPTDKRISLSMYDFADTISKGRFEYLATILPTPAPDALEAYEQMHHAIIKKRTYLDGITIDVIDNRNASAIVPKSTIIQIMKSHPYLPSYLKSPLRLIYERLEKDFNFHNLNHLKYHYWENDESLFYNFHRQ